MKTSWFVHNVKPARPGVYETLLIQLNQSTPMYSYWNGEAWHVSASSIAVAEQLSKGGTSFAQDKEWRGIYK